MQIKDWSWYRVKRASDVVPGNFLIRRFATGHLTDGWLMYMIVRAGAPANEKWPQSIMFDLLPCGTLYRIVEKVQFDISAQGQDWRILREWMT